MLQGNSLAARDVASFIHPYTNLATHLDKGPLVIERGQGVFVYDDTGRDYLEGMAGLWCASLGFSEPELVEAAIKQMRSLPFYHTFTGKGHEPSILLAEKLKAMMPFPASKVFFANSGSEANDTQVKLAWYVMNARGEPKRKKIISRNKAYHGVTVAAASLTGLANNHRDFDLPIANILHTDCPHHYRFAQAGETEEAFASRLADNLEAMILREGPETIAAFIAEPVMGAGGVLTPPATYFEKVQKVLSKYGILLIDDEVICGFGRTANMFAAETYGITPNSMSVAKALSSAYMPISAVVVDQQMFDGMVEESRKIGTFGHGYTYSGHPVAAAVALRTLEIYEERNILGHVRDVTPHFLKRLRGFADHPLVGEVRGVGLVGAIELVADKKSKRSFAPDKGVGNAAVARALEHGLIVRGITDSIAFCPPLIITEAEIDLMFDRFAMALSDIEAWVAKDNLRAA